MSWTDFAILKPLLLPPGLLLVAALVGVIRGTARARRVAVAAVVLLAGLSLPVTAKFLMTWVEGEWSVRGGEDGAAVGDPPAAIIVLAGDYRSFAPEYGEASVGALTLMRLRHGAHLHRTTGLPVLLSGGGTPPEHQPGLGEAMRLAFERDFGVVPRWVEGASRNTFENARESARILRAAGIRRAHLVTSAFHMRRAVLAFEAVGYPVVPAPTGGLSRGHGLRAGDFLPEAAALQNSAYALHEIAGLAWYGLVARVPALTGR